MYKTDVRREKVSKAKRIVIKVGTSTITHENGRFNLTNMENLCRSIANLMNQGKEVILCHQVQSGLVSVSCACRKNRV
jgi:glutamate 5-kinase